MGLLLLMGFVFVGGTSWFIRGALDSRALAVIEAKQDLQTAYDLQVDYQRASEEIAKQEERLKKAPPQRLATYVESLASKHSVREGLRGVKEESATKESGIKITTYEVEFRKVSLEPLLNVLKDMESSNYPLRVEDARFKTVYFKREKLIDLTLEVVVYSLAEAQ
jgi:hypothetical protein